MGTVSDKLTYLKGTKEAIAKAIEEKEVTVPSGATFRDYAGLIGQIQGGGSGTVVKLQDGTAMPTGEEFTVYPDEGYDGFSSVTVEGDTNLKPENVAEGITIFGVTGTLKIGSEGTLPEAYQQYVEHAKLLYTGEYANMLVAESNGAVTVGFLLDNFKVTEFNESSTEFKASGWVAVKYIKSTSTWGTDDWSSATSEGQNYISHIRYCTCYIYYNTKIIYPAVTPEPEPTGTYTVKFVNGTTILQTVTDVIYGGNASYTGEVPTSEDGLTFVGWQPNSNPVYGDLVCYAQFSDTVIPSLIADSWEEIVANRGISYPIGAYKPFNLELYGTTYTIKMQKVYGGEDAAASVWLALNTINNSWSFNVGGTSQDSVGRWAESNFRTKLNTIVFQAIPEEIRNGIKLMTKYSDAYESNVYIENDATADRLWIPSMQEIYGSNETRGVQYKLVYKTNTVRKNITGCLFRTVSPKGYSYKMNSYGESVSTASGLSGYICIGFGL